MNDEDRTYSYAFRFEVDEELIPDEDKASPGIDGYVGKIVLEDDSSEVVEEVGEIDATIIRLASIWECGVDPYDICDGVSADLERVAAAMFDKEEWIREEVMKQFSNEWGDTVIYIDRVCVVPKHRGQNLGLRAVRRFVDTIGHGAKWLVLFPFPLHAEDDTALSDISGSDFRAAKKKLQKYWSRLGVRPLVTNRELYAANLNLRLPTMKDLMPGARTRKQSKQKSRQESRQESKVP